MTVLNFSEVPQANTGSGVQDTFELFARDFFKYLGYEVSIDPARGADGGMDLILKETRKGIGGTTELKWLVSCKHYAHSGKSVAHTDELNIRDRVESHGCQGFIGFYSTLASSGLMTALEGNKKNFEYQIFDHKKIESSVLHSSAGLKLAERYFPASISAWLKNNPKPAKLFSEEPSLKCAYCDEELLGANPKGIVVLWERYPSNTETGKSYYEDMYWCCKGNCDTVLSARRNNKPWIDGWEDIPDVAMPTVFIKWVMTVLNEQRKGVEYSDDAFRKMKEFMLNVFPHVSRHLTSTEEERIDLLRQIPTSFGGMG